MILGGKMTLEELNFELECLAEEERQERIDFQYQEFCDEMYYALECEQMDRDMELYEDF